MHNVKTYPVPRNARRRVTRTDAPLRLVPPSSKEPLEIDPAFLRACRLYRQVKAELALGRAS